jgi:hypothetical protein
LYVDHPRASENERDCDETDDGEDDDEDERDDGGIEGGRDGGWATGAASLVISLVTASWLGFVGVGGEGKGWCSW